MIDKKPFVRFELGDDDLDAYPKSLWVNKELRELMFDVGCCLRQSQISTIIRQALEIAQANLRGNEKISEILYGNGTRNRRKGLDDLDLVKKELRQNLSNSKKS